MNINISDNAASELKGSLRDSGYEKPVLMITFGGFG